MRVQTHDASDPKRLYHLIEDVFARADDSFNGRRLLVGCAEAFFERFRQDLGLVAVYVYAARRAGFHREAALGLEAGAPAAVLDRTDPLLRHLLSGPGVDTLAEGPAGALLGLRLDEPRAKHLLLLRLAPGSDATRALVLAKPLRAALSARILQNRWGQSLREAAEIQRGLLPVGMPALDGFTIAALSQPAEEVGGDVYDVARMDEHTVAIAVADASGHGLPAALVARDITIGLRMGLRSGQHATRLLENLSEVIHSSSLSNSFVSVFYGELTSDGTLLYANAGHPPPLIARADGVEALRWGDTVLGPTPRARFRRHVTQLAPGDTLVAYTDGITERRNEAGAFFGAERLAEIVARCRGTEPAETLARVLASAEAFAPGTPWEDDASVLVIQRHLAATTTPERAPGERRMRLGGPRR
ncbi:MAG: PP2C family protein-serine/threonine phosphatase [Planctomycetota bacterium]|nr:PP2C family protein-serine/threonine phosphatase [Planctomycetota bacterium]